MPQVVVLGRLRDTGEYADIERHPDAEVFPGVLILRIDRIWFFANADGIRNHIKATDQCIAEIVAHSHSQPGSRFYD